MANIKLMTLALLTAVGGAVLVAFLLRSNSKLRDENLALREQLTRLRQPFAQGVPLSNALPPEQAAEYNPGKWGDAGTGRGNAGATGPSRELLRLRGEVTVLRNQVAEIAKTEQQKQMIVAKMDSARQLSIAFAAYALDHQEQFPTNFSSVVASLAATGFDPAEVTNRFEIVYQGTHEVPHPEKIILVREREAWPAPQGGWYRTYGFADNHSELHYSADGDFTAWEDHYRAKPDEP